VKYTADRPFADPDKAARKLIEIANSAEAYMPDIPARLQVSRLVVSFGRRTQSSGDTGFCLAPMTFDREPNRGRH
jgi:hypothetical protein